MKYTEAERMNIGRRIYEDEITQNEAAEEYCITPTTAKNYIIRFCRETCYLQATKQCCAGKQKQPAVDLLQQAEKVLCETIQQNVWCRGITRNTSRIAVTAMPRSKDAIT